MQHFANFNTNRFVKAFMPELERWGKNSAKYPSPEMANSNQTLAMLTAMELGAKKPGVGKYKVRTIRDRTKPGKPVTGMTVTYDTPEGTVLDGLVSNPDYRTGKVLEQVVERHGNNIYAKNVFSEKPYLKAGWTQTKLGWQPPSN